MKQSSVRLIWASIMTLFYLIMAVLLAFFDVFGIQPVLRIILGILFFAYGLFRGYRAWKMDNNK